MEERINYTAEQKREVGKQLYYNDDSTCAQRQYGLNLIMQAYMENDPEAIYIVACLVLREIVEARNGGVTETAMAMIARSASFGYPEARKVLNAYCEDKYRERFSSLESHCTGERLVDFDGEPIAIDRRGKRMPINAVLCFENGRNILELSANLNFIYAEELPNREQVEQAVLRGLYEWQGDYEVFGGQKLTVKLHLTREERMSGSVLIFPLAGKTVSEMKNFTNRVAVGQRRKWLNSVLNYHRSFAFSGLRWRSDSRKLIFVQSKNGRFDDYDDLMHVTKHEFGHTLGLGDLYPSAVDSLAGVKKGTYPELDCYAVGNSLYNLVMCDYHGPVSNNDIEMVVLAFRENTMQLYQPQKRLKGKISSALGRGN